MHGVSPPTRLSIVVKGYPRLSETFVAQELLELQRRGFIFDIWSLRLPYDDKEHPIHGQITAPRRYLPEYLHEEPLRLLRGIFTAARLPGFQSAFRLWLRDLRRDFNRSRIRRFGQSCILASELDPDCTFLYVHFLHTPASVVRYASAMRGLKWGFAAHAKDIWTIPDWEKAEKIADSEFGVTCTKSGAAHLQEFGGEKIRLVYHGLDLKRFPAPPAERDGSRPFQILSVGRLVEKKGYDDLLEALNLLPRDFDWHFTQIGGGQLSREMRSHSKRLQLEERITWLGKRDQTSVIEAMRSADLFVLPSKIADDGDRDGLPNVLMEAASQKLPILSTKVSAIPEFITHGVHGILTEPGDPAALADAIAILAADQDLRNRIADAAYDRLRVSFGVESGIDILEARLLDALTSA